MRSYSKSKLPPLFVLILTCMSAYSQISISGQSCATNGEQRGYLYSISGKIDDSDQITWKITGGKIAGSNNVSASGTVASIGTQIRVNWSSVSGGKIEILHNRLGVGSLDVKVIALNNSIMQPSVIIKKGSSFTINGNGPGSNVCTLLFNYWWEYSKAANGPFNSMDNSIGKNLNAEPISERTYYRRALAVNGDVFYSNVILIDPQ